MANMIEDIKAFHEKFGITYNGKPRVLPEYLAQFRRKFLLEEAKEYDDASAIAQQALSQLSFLDHDPIPPALEDMLDGLVDTVYVALGNAYLHGFDFEKAWERVHEANMRKVRAQTEADSKRGNTNDVVKPPGWTPPSHRDLVIDHAHKKDPVFRWARWPQMQDERAEWTVVEILVDRPEVVRCVGIYYLRPIDGVEWGPFVTRQP